MSQEAFDVTESTIAEVIAEVESGRLAPEDALKAERAADAPRTTLIEKLEQLSKPVNQPAAPSTTASALSAGEADAKANPNGYEKAKVKTSAQVNQNTGGLGTYYDPEMKQSVGKEAVTVFVTPFIDALLRNKELVKG